MVTADNPFGILGGPAKSSAGIPNSVGRGDTYHIFRRS